MPFGKDNIQRKGEAAYKTIYLRQRLIDQIEKLAAENETSFNAIVTSMIEQCLKDYEESSQKGGTGE